MTLASFRHVHATHWFPAVLTSVVAITLFSSWNRPLLYDEFIYLMAGAAPSFSDALGVVDQTTTNVNQGVTGAYLLADWALLNLFGAHAWALRLPSLIFAAVMISYAAVFLRARGVNPLAFTLFPLFLLTQDLVMHYSGEARTYMPLAAAVVGLLAYYSLPLEKRSSWWVRGVGWSAVLIGVLFHPYIALYWPLVALFAYFAFQPRTGWRPFLRFINAPLVLLGAVLYMGIAFSTWARGRATAYVDPFNFLPGPLPIEIVAQNFYSLRFPIISLSAIAVVLITLAAFFAPSVLRSGNASVGKSLVTLLRIWIAPLALITVALLASFIISLTSIAADFWIFPRQWIASTALIALAIFWGAWETWRHIADADPTWGRWMGGVAIGAIVISAGAIAVQQWSELRDWSARESATAPSQSQLISELEAGNLLTDGEWMAFAQVNVDSGGEIWPQLWTYYRDTDWSQFVLQDGSSSLPLGR